MKNFLLATACLLLASCADLTHRIDTMTGYAIKDGAKEDGAVFALRHVLEGEIAETGINWGLMSEFNFVYTEDALNAHNYDLREFGLSPLLTVSYPNESGVTPYVALGPTLRWFEADSDSVETAEVQIDLRAGVSFAEYFIEYRGTNQDYPIRVDTSGWSSSRGYEDSKNGEPPPPPGVGRDKVNQWVNSFNVGVQIPF